jgi:hypothetical protein
MIIILLRFLKTALITLRENVSARADEHTAGYDCEVATQLLTNSNWSQS